MKVLIIGGGAGGASCAARLRRLDENAEITILEKTSETSIASCGLPYFIGNIISEREQMQVAKPDFFKDIFNINIKLNSEVVSFDNQKKTLQTADGDSYIYDKLVLSVGAKPFIPAIKGLELIPHFMVKNLSDADNIKSFLAQRHPQHVTIIGGGFIGVEIAENLNNLGFNTSIIEQSPQILPPLDLDMAKSIHSIMEANNIRLYLGDGVKEITLKGIKLNSGTLIKSDIIIFAIGIRPDTDWVVKSGVKTDKRGAILTNEFMQTNLPDVYACGDSVAVCDFVSKTQQTIALAGPANRQGRLIADHISGNPYPYRYTQGTGIVKVFDTTVAFTGNNEKQLIRSNIKYQKMIIIGNSHAGYYPNGQNITLKVLFNQEGKILGAQAFGKEGIDKRIDIIATIMRLGGTTRDLRDAELCYAPPYSGAKDVINIMGMAIENIRGGLFRPCFDTDFSQCIILDVRPTEMYQKEHIENAINIPAAQIRKRLNDLPKDKTIIVHCVKGYTSYVVSRILNQNGFKNVLSYAGGWTFYKSQQ